MLRHLAAAALLLACAVPVPAWAQAQPGPAGLWRQVDEDTGQSQAIVRVFEQGGVLFGRIEKVLDPTLADRRCTRCSGDMKDQPVQGLVFIRGLHRDGGEWTGGTITDPRDGVTYRCTLRLGEGGRTLVLRGYVGLSLLGRSQTWLRQE